jgi:hypothetical protein
MIKPNERMMKPQKAASSQLFIKKIATRKKFASGRSSKQQQQKSIFMSSYIFYETAVLLLFAVVDVNGSGYKTHLNPLLRLRVRQNSPPIDTMRTQPNTSSWAKAHKTLAGRMRKVSSMVFEVPKVFSWNLLKSPREFNN